MYPFDKPVDKLEYKDLDSYFDKTPRPEEDLHVEFKLMLPKAKNHDLAEEMVAFANKEGGLIFIGIGEDDQRRAIWPTKGIAVSSQD